MRCHICGRFVKDVVAQANGFGEIIRVTGSCSKDGSVELKNWDYEDFFPEEKYGGEK